jgi:hypothetical protein
VPRGSRNERSNLVDVSPEWRNHGIRHLDFDGPTILGFAAVDGNGDAAPKVDDMSSELQSR